MDKKEAVEALSALAQETRLDVFRLLVQAGAEGLAAGEIATRIGAPQNTLSNHLGILSRAGLAVGERRGRNILYHADFARMSAVLAYLLKDCCGGKPAICGPLLESVAPESVAPIAGRGRSAWTDLSMKQEKQMTENRIYNVLFLCTGNSARSIIAECLMNRLGRGRFKAFSAGSHPKGEVHPYALDLLRSLHYATEGLRSKSWDEFAQPGAPALDFVFTVCDNAAQEACPAWPGQPMTAHWGVPDPAAAEGSEAERRFAFADSHRMLNNRIGIFVSLPLDKIDKLALKRKLDEIGEGRAE